MDTKNVIVLALVVVLVLTGWLVFAVSPKGDNGAPSQPTAQVEPTQLPASGTTGSEAVKSSAQVVSDNVKTQVNVK